MVNRTLTAEAAAWVAAADAAWAAMASEVPDPESYTSQWLIPEEVDPEEAEEEFPTPFGPAIDGAGPVVLLDVDGVLSPFRSPKRTHWTSWRQVPGFGFDAPVSPQMGAALRALPVDYAWLTTWEDKAPSYLAPTIGLGSYPFFPLASGQRFKSERDGWAKLHVVRQWLRTYGPRPLVWVDDDHRMETLVPECPYVSSLPALLTIVPDRNVGLLPEHLDAIRAFAVEHAP